MRTVVITRDPLTEGFVATVLIPEGVETRKVEGCGNSEDQALVELRINLEVNGRREKLRQYTKTIEVDW